MRLLRQIADGDVLARPRLALIVGVDPGHDLHQRGFARAVGADDADLGALVELQADVLQHRLLGGGEGLGHALHDIGVLGGHRASFGSDWRVVDCARVARVQIGRARHTGKPQLPFENGIPRA